LRSSTTFIQPVGYQDSEETHSPESRRGRPQLAASSRRNDDSIRALSHDGMTLKCPVSLLSPRFGGVFSARDWPGQRRAKTGSGRFHLAGFTKQTKLSSFLLLIVRPLVFANVTAALRVTLIGFPSLPHRKFKLRSCFGPG
jgi:hypothetical protein